MSEESGVELLEKPKNPVVTSSDELDPEEKMKRYLEFKKREMATDPRTLPDTVETTTE